MSYSLSTWAPSTIPTSTTLRHVAQTHAPALLSSLSAAEEVAQTATLWKDLLSLSRNVRGAQASLTIISAEEVLATATNSDVLASATQAIFNATLNLKALEWSENLYGFELQKAPNIIYLVIYFISLVFTGVMVVWSRYHWFNVTFFCGAALEFLGFLGRVLSFNATGNMHYYILQTVGLTIAPAFIMAGIYFLFAQLVVLHGRQYSVLKPMWYSYFFITTDVFSLLVQAAGGGLASYESSQKEDTSPGTNTMIVGICVQTAAMTVFLCFWFIFLWHLYFRSGGDVEHPIKRSPTNYVKLLLNVKSVQPYRREIEQFYNPKFADIRQRRLVPYYPLAITVAVVVVYIRCVYRVVELIMGYGGYLIKHEVFLMVLDASMVSICMLIFIPFHPYFAFGPNNVLKLETIKKNKDEHEEKDHIDNVAVDSYHVGEKNSDDRDRGML